MAGILTVGPVFPGGADYVIDSLDSSLFSDAKMGGAGRSRDIDWEMTLSQMGRGIRLAASGF